jgi:hypothetical protein
MNKFVKSSLNVSAILAIILAILSFIVPFLLWGFLIIGLGLLLWIGAIFWEKKTLWIVSVILCILSLMISPTFWLYLSGLSLSPKTNISVPSYTQSQSQNEMNTDTNNKVQPKEEKQETQEEVEARLNELWKVQTPTTKKVFTYAIIKQDNGSYDYYTTVYQMGLKENMDKAFSQKGLKLRDVKVNIKGINHKVVLETNALEISKNPEWLKEFLDLYKWQELKKEVDNNLTTNVKYPVTPAILEKYKDVITEMNNYSGFSAEWITQ